MAKSCLPVVDNVCEFSKVITEQKRELWTVYPSFRIVDINLFENWKTIIKKNSLIEFKLIRTSWIFIIYINLWGTKKDYCMILSSLLKDSIQIKRYIFNFVNDLIEPFPIRIITSDENRVLYKHTEQKQQWLTNTEKGKSIPKIGLHWKKLCFVFVGIWQLVFFIECQVSGGRTVVSWKLCRIAEKAPIVASTSIMQDHILLELLTKIWN